MIPGSRRPTFDARRHQEAIRLQQRQDSDARARFDAEFRHRQQEDAHARARSEAERNDEMARFNAQQRQRALGTRGGGGAVAAERITPTSRAQDMASVVVALQDAAARGVTRDNILKEIERSRPTYLSRGLDMAEILAEVDRGWPAPPRRNWWGNLDANLPGRLRGWLPGGVRRQ